MTKDKPDVATSFHRIIKHIAYMPKKKKQNEPFIYVSGFIRYNEMLVSIPYASLSRLLINIFF